MSRPFKMMIITDSSGNPRSFPTSEVVELEETFPYLLRQRFPDAVVWQLSFGSMPTPKILSQPMSYLTHWAPDVIVVQSGMADCGPTPMTDFEREIVKRLTGPFYGRVAKYLYSPRVVRARQAVPVSKPAFRRILRQFRLVFPKSRIVWLGICAGAASEKKTPGLGRKMAEYNEILEETYKDDFVPIQQLMDEVKGFNSLDHTHWNRRGHAAIADLLTKKIADFLSSRG